MPTETRLRRTFSDVLTTILATAACAACGGGGGDLPSSGGTSSGGSSGTSSGTSGTPGTTTYASACTTQKTFLEGLTTTPPIDGAVVRTEAAYPPLPAPAVDDGDDLWTSTQGDAAGSLCATASDKAACLDKVANYRVLPPTRAECNAQYGSVAPYDGRTCTASYVLYTRGDEIGVARSQGEQRALAAPFDTLEEARWAATTAGYSIVCGQGSAPKPVPDSEFRVAAGGGFDMKVREEKNCGKTTYDVTIHVDANGNVTELSRTDLGEEPSCMVAGRRPEGLCLDREPRGGVGPHFAAMATLEAASVVAFRRLHRQLAARGAPGELLARVRRAARDEVRHARRAAALARKYGVTPRRPEILPASVPTLLEIALENAREGCVRETYGALVAHLQVERAADPDVRAAMAAIAGEETAHAALSWDVAAWIEPQLTAAERARVAAERQDAFTTLARELAVAVEPSVRRAAGVPAPDEAARMLDGLAPLMLAGLVPLAA
ncbi:MAG: hypothetical protein KIT84_00790 [Labilithrix sp.]|nr:hypothetical protein [Labilithrix sp.]MCW5809520.1 hypothetical protein [Labilithrix sp.]